MGAEGNRGLSRIPQLTDQIARGTGPKGQDKIARAVGRIETELFDITVAEDGFTFARNPARIAAEARLDGFYVIRTSVEDKALAGDRVVALLAVDPTQL